MADNYDEILKLLMVEEKLRGHPHLANLKAKVDKQLMELADKAVPPPSPKTPVYPEGTTIQHPTTETASPASKVDPKERRV